MKIDMIDPIQTLLRKVVLLTAVAAAVMPAAAAEINLQAEAVPKGTVVRLGDVAEIRSADAAEAERLAALPLMPVPSAGSQRFLRLREVQDLLAAHGEDLGRHVFRGESAVAIATDYAGSLPAASSIRALRQTAWANGVAKAGAKAEVLSASEADELNERVRRALEKHVLRASGQPGNWRVTLEVPRRQLALLATAASELECTGGKAPWIGRHRFVIAFATKRGGVSQFSVVAEVTRPRQVVVALGPIERGRVLTAADVEMAEWENPPAAAAHQAVVESVEALIGKEAARPIRAGEVIMAGDVRLPILVRRGEEIAVMARGGGIQVRTTARARQDGARGELVQVESLATRERFDAVVTGPREAVVFAGNATPSAEVADRPMAIPQK